MTKSATYMPNWKIIKGDSGLGDNWLSSEIYADTPDGLMNVLRVPLVLTRADHDKLGLLEKQHRLEESQYLSNATPKNWLYSLFGVKGKEHRQWSNMILRHMNEREDVYKTRKSSEYHKAHRHLLLSTPYAYELLAKYRETGVLDRKEVQRVLDIAEGKFTPIIIRKFGFTGERDHKSGYVAPLLDEWRTTCYNNPSDTYFASMGYSTDIRAVLPNGETVTVANVAYPLSEADKEELGRLERKQREEVQAFCEREKIGRFGPLKETKIEQDAEFKSILKEYDPDVVYRNRRSAEYCKAHIHLVLACPHMYKLLASYHNTGFNAGLLDRRAVSHSLDIAEGRIVPITNSNKDEIRSQVCHNVEEEK
jgi:hypothetical protein